MKIYSRKISFLMLISIFSLTSCDLYVDKSEMLTLDIILKDESNVQLLWATLYSEIPNGFNDVSNTLIASACDEADNNQPFSLIQSFNDGSWNEFNAPNNRWSSSYNAIYKANLFLRLTDSITYIQYKIPDPTYYNTITTDLYNYRLDAQFFKAYFHYELFKRFGNVPIMDREMTVAETALQKRQSNDSVKNYIVGLLDSIIPKLEVTWESAYFGRITKGAAMALKCKVLITAASPLYNNGSYNNDLCIQAANAAQDIIDMGLYRLTSNYRTLFTDITPANSEIIFDYRIANSNTLEEDNYPAGGNRLYSNGVGGNATCPSQNLVDAFETINGKSIIDDPTYDPLNPYTKRDPRLEMTVIVNNSSWNDSTVQAYVGGVAGIGKKNATTTGYYLKKFVQEKVNLTTNSTASHVWHIIRYGEILLIYAEAMNEAFGPDVIPSGFNLSAREAVNQIRARQGVAMPPISAGLSKSEFRDKLRNERRVELAFEGQRFWDVRRWMIAAETENAPLMGMWITKTGSNSFSYEVKKVEDRKFISPAMYLYPIPYSDLNHYEGWEQNPGW